LDEVVEIEIHTGPLSGLPYRALELEAREALFELPLVDVHFRGCRVSASCRLGAEGAGREIALSSLALFRVTDAAGAVGLASRAQEAAIEHAYARLHADARLDALGPQHALLAEIRAELFAAAALVNRATQEPHREGALAKLFATQAATRIVSRLAQLQSANGLEAGTVSERLQRAIRAPRNEDPAELYRAVLAPMLAPTR
jgi:acyl-CoA dehydrogenase